ncbi:MAG: sugar phosphate nucleotidyltransferase [Candidatus Levybacteria bacterium]|nr:sugar phosphate nucleotidyltransferase [Candidatus Levybacteria bacterium]
MKIPVVIFCGGQGTRMKEETEFRPKPMVTVGEKPILWHIMKVYAHYGFNKFIIALGYKGNYIKEYFLNEEYFTHDLTINTLTGKKNVHRKSKKKHDNFSITFVDTGLETLTGERLLKVKDYIKSDKFMVTYGDGVGNVNIPELISFHDKKKTIGTITGVHPKSKWGLIVSDKNNIIEHFEQKPRLNQYVNGGFMVFDREIFKHLRAKETIEDTFDRLTKKRALAVYIHKGYWAAMDTYQDVEYLNKEWYNGPKWKIWN